MDLAENRKVEVTAGGVYFVELPYSEVCMYMRVAGVRTLVRVLAGFSGVQIYMARPQIEPLRVVWDDFSAPITMGEAGFYYDPVEGFYYYPPSKI